MCARSFRLRACCRRFIHARHVRDMDQKPEWVRWSNFGVGSLTDAGQLEAHFHDADEYWLVFQGRARVRSEGQEYELGPGDILCTRMGDEHDALEIWKPRLSASLSKTSYGAANGRAICITPPTHRRPTTWPRAG